MDFNEIEELNKKIKEYKKERGIYSSFEEWFDFNKTQIKKIKDFLDIKEILKIGWESRSLEIEDWKDKYYNLIKLIGGREIIEGAVLLPEVLNKNKIIFQTLVKVIIGLIIILGIYSLI